MMANFPGTVASPVRARAYSVDAGPVTRKERTGIQRGFNVKPYNIITRGLARRVDTTKIP